LATHCRFENRTGEVLLDGSIEYALSSELARSAYVNVTPVARIGDTLKLMREDPGVKLTEERARELAIRDGGINAVVAGRVERFGSRYVLTLRLVRPADGRTEGVLERVAPREQLPDAARMLAQDLRRQLGDPRIQSRPQPQLERATTASLAALRVFSLGMNYLNRGNAASPTTISSAAELFDEAAVDDPGFALAHIYAAVCYSDMRQPDKAVPHYEAAIRLAPGVTDRERLFIQGTYYERYSHDDLRALAEYRTLTNLYPDDYAVIDSLAEVSDRLGMHDEAMEARRRAIALRPNDEHTIWELLAICRYERRNRPERARRSWDELRTWRATHGLTQFDPAYFDALFDLEPAIERWERGDVSGAAREITRTSEHALAQTNDYYTLRLVDANEVVGKIRAARALCDHFQNPALRAERLLLMAMLAENREEGRVELERLRDATPGPFFGYADGLAAIWLSDVPLARKWRPALVDVDGAMLWAQGRATEAIQRLRAVPQPVGSNGANWSNVWFRYALASALEQQGRIGDAIAAITDDTRPANVDLLTAVPWPYARLKLAYLCRKSGRTLEAARVEAEMEHYLSEADPDHPVRARMRTMSATARN
jgi:Tfp pilus assembly protein PilF